jgi:hypothetical protein
MKTKIYLLITMIIIAGCSDSNTNKFDKYLKYKWGNENEIILENGYIHSYTHYDTNLLKMVGDTLIPIRRIDTNLIITKIVEKRKCNNVYEYISSSDTIVTDTFIFEFKKFNGVKLLLFKDGNYRPIVHNLLENKTVIETNHLGNIKFEIAGYLIGDTINRDLLEINNVINSATFSLEQGELKSNDEIDIDIIGGKFVFGITQRNISDYDIDDIIKVVNAKLGIKPKHTPLTKGKAMQQEYYSWSTNRVEIFLLKRTYTGSELLWRSYSTDGWTLSYADKIMQGLLINEFKNSNPKSTIIN